MFTNQIINYDRQRKAKLGDEIIISGDPRTYIKYSKTHNGHKAKIIGGKQKATPAGISIKWHYQVQCICDDSTEWITANGFNNES